MDSTIAVDCGLAVNNESAPRRVMPVRDGQTSSTTLVLHEELRAAVMLIQVAHQTFLR